MRLLLVRHSQPLSSTVALGDACPPDETNALSAAGSSQAHVLGQTLARICDGSAVKLISSPVVRALQTAQTVAAHLGSPPIEIDGRLAERLKDWSGAPSVAEIQAEERVAFQYPHVRTPIGESLIEHRSRVASFFDELVSQCEDERSVLLVCHGGTIEHILGIVLGVDVGRMLKLCFALGNGCFHELSHSSAPSGGGEWAIQRLNVEPTP